MQDDDADANGVARREKARLKEMQRMKKQKIQEILDAQNATIDADMVIIFLLDIVTFIGDRLRFFNLTWIVLDRTREERVV